MPKYVKDRCFLRFPLDTAIFTVSKFNITIWLAKCYKHKALVIESLKVYTESLTNVLCREYQITNSYPIE